MTSNNLFPQFKTTGDEKLDLETYIEDLIDYCIMQNWYDTLKETDEAKWTKPDKVMACLRASLSPAARMLYKYGLGLSKAGLKKPHSVVNALREYYGASVGVSGERQKFLRLLQQENELITSWETKIRNQASQCEYEDFADFFQRWNRTTYSTAAIQFCLSRHKRGSLCYGVRYNPTVCKEIFCESTPDTWRENKSCEGAEQLCIHL